jgi:teichuronic acid biosynthesis glycosyltransferase TuaG
VSRPSVSIITPCYNSESYLVNCIESVLAQTYEKWELILINDGSVDGTLSICEHYQKSDRRIKLINHKYNRGINEARNTGIDHAIGAYIAFLDSDDRWLPSKLWRQFELINDGDAVVSYTGYYVIDDTDKRIKKLVPPKKLDFEKLLKSNFIGNLTGMVSRKLVGDLRVEKVGHEDYVFWLRVLQRTDFAYGIQEPLAEYRVHGNNSSGNKLRTAKWQWNIYRKVLGFTFFKSAYLIFWYTYNGFFKYSKP